LKRYWIDANAIIWTNRKLFPYDTARVYWNWRICLAGSGRDQLQSFGRGKKEQLLEERGCGPELLAASL